MAANLLSSGVAWLNIGCRSRHPSRPVDDRHLVLQKTQHRSSRTHVSHPHPHPRKHLQVVKAQYEPGLRKAVGEVAAEEAVEGAASKELHETSARLSAELHVDARSLEAQADQAADAAAAQASSPPSPHDSGLGANVGDGHEEGRKAADSMTP